MDTALSVSSRELDVKVAVKVMLTFIGQVTGKLFCFRKQKQEEAIKEVKAHMAREKMREFAVKQEPPTNSTVDYGPTPRAAVPYGSWKPVQNE